MTKTYEQNGVCGACFRRHAISADGRLVRHGFAVHTVPGQGLVGAWHTGDCVGSRLRDLWSSSEGTVVAVERVEGFIAQFVAELDRLAERPRLSVVVLGPWRSNIRRDGRYTERVTLCDGDEARYPDCADERGRDRENRGGHADWQRSPSYAQVHAEHVEQAQVQLDVLRASLPKLQAALASWAAEAPANARQDAAATKKLPAVHLKVSGTVKRLHRYGSGVVKQEEHEATSSICVGLGWARRAARYHLTEDAAEVTCTRCLRDMKKREERAAQAR